MIALFNSAEFWVVMGLLLILSEWFIPSFIVFFFGLGALVVAFLTAVGLVSSLPVQLALLPIVGVTLLLLLRKHCQRWMKGSVSDGGDTDHDDTSLIGQRAVVQSDFSQGHGTVLLNGSRWQARSEDLLVEGDAAIVVGHKSITLTVIKAPAAQ